MCWGDLRVGPASCARTPASTPLAGAPGELPVLAKPHCPHLKRDDNNIHPAGLWWDLEGATAGAQETLLNLIAF